MTRQITILIVDDDESVRDGMVTLMQSHGYAAAAFESGENFLLSDASRRTGCLIADMHMHGMTGLELLNRLASAGHSIPAILITARHDENLRARATQAGAFCYLAKPFREDDPLNCIRSALASRNGEPPP